MPITKLLYPADTGNVPVKIWTDDIEEAAQQQLKNIASLPFIHKHVAAMPDVHWGMGATVGSVIAAEKAVIPAAVGVDIGCGMLAVKTTLKANDLPDNLASIRSSIERGVPVGFNTHADGPKFRDGTPIIESDDIFTRLTNLEDKHPDIRWKGGNKVLNQLGTLGGGNHFIELCLDKEDCVWIMLHSGSRNVGKVIAEYFISRAKKLMERYFITLPDKDLAYLPEGEQDFTDYIDAVGWAQDYAKENRDALLRLVMQELQHYFPTISFSEAIINCHHNYISRENHYGKNVIVTRKGAIRAREGEMGIIPGSMGARSFIVRGKGNTESFHSCSHGAGRRMSRSAANKQFTIQDLVEQTAGVECRKDSEIIDEIPSAYKPIDEVMANQADLVDIVVELKQILCVKG